MARNPQLVSLPGVKAVGTYQKESGNNGMRRNPATADVRVPLRAMPGGGPKRPASPSVPLGSTARR